MYIWMNKITPLNNLALTPITYTTSIVNTTSKVIEELEKRISKLKLYLWWFHIKSSQNTLIQ